MRIIEDGGSEELNKVFCRQSGCHGLESELTLGYIWARLMVRQTAKKERLMLYTWKRD